MAQRKVGKLQYYTRRKSEKVRNALSRRLQIISEHKENDPCNRLKCQKGKESFEAYLPFPRPKK